MEWERQAQIPKLTEPATPEVPGSPQDGLESQRLEQGIPTAGVVAAPSTPPLGSVVPGNTRAVLAISGEARLTQQILQITEKKITENHFPEVKTLRDFYLPTGTFLLESLLQAAQWQEKIEQHIQRRVDGESSKSKRSTSKYEIRGPLRLHDYDPSGGVSDIHSLPSDKITIKAVRDDNTVHGDKDDVFRLNTFLGWKKQEESGGTHGNASGHVGARLEAGEDPPAFVHLVAVDFDQFGCVPPGSTIDHTSLLKCMGIDSACVGDGGKLRILLGKGRAYFVIKCKNEANWHDKRPSHIRDALTKFLEHKDFGLHTVLVVSAEELRAYHVPISYQVSWERTIQSTLANLRQIFRDPDHLYHFLQGAGHLVITFGCEGALYVQTRRTESEVALERAYCIIDPGTTEGDLVHKFGPRMRGFDSAITAGIAHCLITDLTDVKKASRSPGDLDLGSALAVNKGIVRGLKAGRFLQIHGFTGILPRSEDKEWPKELDRKEDRENECPPGTSRVQRRRLFHPRLFHPRLFAGRWIRCVRRRYFVASPPFPYTHAHLLPLDLLGCIIQNGSLDWRSWFPIPMKSSNSKEVEPLRRFGVRLNREWEAIGWFHSHFLDGKDIASILGDDKLHSQRSGKKEVPPFLRVPYYDASWWSFLNDLFIPSVLYPPRRNRAQASEEVCRQLAENILIHGLKWLKSDHRRDQDRLKVFLEKSLRLVWHRGHPSSTPVEVPKKDQEAIYKACRPRMERLLGADWESLKDSPESDLGSLFTTLIAQQEKEPELPTLLGVVPYTTVGDFHTIDRRETENVRNLASVVRNYASGHYKTPLNLGVFGPAGSGKNFIIEQVCNDLATKSGGPERRKIQSTTFNLSQFESVELLTQAFEEIQDIGLRGLIPLVFWDEYDSELNRQPLGWLRYFLGPMNDGLYFQRERTRRLPQAIFVFAGSMFSSYMSMDVLNHYSETGQNRKVDSFTIDQWRAAKGSDFKSRLSGVLDVLGVNSPAKVKIWGAKGDIAFKEKPTQIGSLPTDEFGYYVRRALILRDRLLKSYPQLFGGKEELQISPKVAQAFLGIKAYTHGARSIRQIVEMSNVGTRGVYDTSCLPTASQLRLHVDPQSFEVWYRELDPRLRDMDQ